MLKQTEPVSIRYVHSMEDLCTIYPWRNFSGKFDYVTPTAPVLDYFNQLRAPHKEIIWFESSGLKNIPIINQHPQDIQKIKAAGIGDEIELLSKGQTKADRAHLSKKLGIKEKTITEYVQVCDYFRMGGKVDAIRPVLYYRMGYNTYEKWANASPMGIIHCFEQYLEENGLRGKYLTPFPKEIGNGIAWARVHQRVFAVEY